MNLNHFSRYAKSGRPKKLNPQNPKNIITKELKEKHQAGLTKEAIDIIFEKKLINTNQYKAARYFKQLYSLCFSNFHLKASNYSVETDCKVASYSEHWLYLRDKEYKNAVKILKKTNSINIVMDICLFNKFSIITRYSSKNSYGIIKLLTALEDLAIFFGFSIPLNTINTISTHVTN